jgi:transposase
MYVCILNQAGETLLHRNMKTNPDTFLKAIAPYRDGIVVAVECMFTWYWLADLCADEGIPFVLGHALSMKAIHGGKAKNDTIDSQKIAALLRGGMLPQASVYPAKMRATRDLLRRRMHLAHTRAELLAHVQKTAKHHDANTLYLLHTVPGIGKILSLVLLYEIHRIECFPRVQEFVSYARLVKCAKESNGKRSGTSGAKIGNAHLTWAFSEAAVLFLRDHPAAQKYLARLEKKHDKGKALSILAHKLGRAVYFMLKRKVAFDMEIFFQTSGSRAGEPGASLDS